MPQFFLIFYRLRYSVLSLASARFFWWKHSLTKQSSAFSGKDSSANERAASVCKYSRVPRAIHRAPSRTLCLQFRESSLPVDGVVALVVNLANVVVVAEFIVCAVVVGLQWPTKGLWGSLQQFAPGAQARGLQRPCSSGLPAFRLA